MRTAPHDPELDAVIGPARLAYFTPSSDFPILADRKAAFLLTASGMLVTVLIFLMHPLVSVLRSPHLLLAGLAGGLLGAVLILVMLAGTWAYKAFILPIPETPPTLALYRHIAAESCEVYGQAMKALTHPEVLQAILHYNYSVAVQGAAKFRRVELALACMRVAIPLWMLLLLIVSLKST